MDLNMSDTWFWFLMALIFILPLVALYHILKHEFKPRNRLIWVLIIVFLPIFGPILYFIMGKKYREENP